MMTYTKGVDSAQAGFRKISVQSVDTLMQAYRFDFQKAPEVKCFSDMKSNAFTTPVLNIAMQFLAPVLA